MSSTELLIHELSELMLYYGITRFVAMSIPDGVTSLCVTETIIAVLSYFSSCLLYTSDAADE